MLLDCDSGLFYTDNLFCLPQPFEIAMTNESDSRPHPYLERYVVSPSECSANLSNEALKPLCTALLQNLQDSAPSSNNLQVLLLFSNGEYTFATR